MSLQRVITEFGTGNDLHGGDYTKAAARAVQDTIHHSSLTLIRSLGVDVRTMQVEVTIGVPRPDLVDKEQVLAVLPHGTGTVNVVEGGLEITNDEGTNKTVVANAAAVVRLEVAERRR